MPLSAYRFCALALLCAAAAPHIPAQGLEISYVQGGNVMRDNAHAIALTNPAPQEADLAGHVLLTRQYALRFPPGTRLAPGGSLRIGKVADPQFDAQRLFTEFQDFMIRLAFETPGGDYALLINGRGKPLAGLVMTDAPSPEFLPETVSFIAFDGSQVPIEAPAPDDPVWQKHAGSLATGQQLGRIAGRWIPAPGGPGGLPPTEYRSARATYAPEGVLLEAEAMFEQGCAGHEVWRSQDGRTFRRLEELPAAGDASGERRNCQYRDAGVLPEQTYYYQFRARGKWGQRVVSEVVEIRTAAAPGGFVMRVRADAGAELMVALQTRDSQRVRVALLDERYRQLAMLYYGPLRADGRFELRYDKALQPGKYYVVAETDARRYVEAVYVE